MKLRRRYTPFLINLTHSAESAPWKEHYKHYAKNRSSPQFLINLSSHAALNTWQLQRARVAALWFKHTSVDEVAQPSQPATNWRSSETMQLSQTS